MLTEQPRVQPTTPLIQRALADESKDRTLAQDAKDRVDVEALYLMVTRLLGERTDLARGIEAIASALSFMRQERPIDQSQEAINSLERIATEALSLAREVIRAQGKD